MDCENCVHEEVCDLWDANECQCAANYACKANGDCALFLAKETHKPGIMIVPDQTVKADAGKPRVSLVPSAIVRAIARVREYGLTRYADPDNWKRVSVERYRDAMYRHVLSYIDDPTGVDEESGLPHLWHIGTNVDFLCALEEGNKP